MRQVKVDFARERRSYTHVLERGVLKLSRRMTIRDVSRFLKVSRDVVKDMQKRNRNQRFANPKLKKLKRIAIDEISTRYALYQKRNGGRRPPYIFP